MSSSGLVPVPDSKRELKLYWPSNAPEPSLTLPAPALRSPVQVADALRVGMRISFGVNGEGKLIAGRGRWPARGEPAPSVAVPPAADQPRRRAPARGDRRREPDPRRQLLQPAD